MKRLGVLKIANYLINVFLRYIGNLFFVVYCKQIDTGICLFYNDIQSDNAKTTSLATAFACHSKSNLSFATSQRHSYFWILLQSDWQNDTVLWQMILTICNTLCKRIQK